MTRPYRCDIAVALVVVMTTVAAAVAAAGDSIETLRFADAAGNTIALDAPEVLYLVDFWAVGCKPCILEMPELERLAKEYEPGGRVGGVAGGWKGNDLLSVARLPREPMRKGLNDWAGYAWVDRGLAGIHGA